MTLGSRSISFPAGDRVRKFLSATQKTPFAKKFFSEGRGSMHFAGSFFSLCLGHKELVESGSESSHGTRENFKSQAL